MFLGVLGYLPSVGGRPEPTDSLSSIKGQIASCAVKLSNIARLVVSKQNCAWLLSMTLRIVNT